MNRSVPDILLVDDSDADAFLIEHAFRKAGVANTIVRLSSGTAALSYLAEIVAQKGRLPVFVLLDMKLPDLSGYELLQWIRSNPGLRQLPVVVITGSQHPEDRQAVELAGANAFYCKNLSFDQLVHLVDSTGAYWSLVPAPDAAPFFRSGNLAGES